MRKILVVEDNPDNMYLITFALEHAGYQVIQAFTGEDGVELALKERPDLIIMDLQLPGIDGLESTRRIRASKADNTVPIIALTSFAMAGDRQRALDAGCTGYMEKPLNPETFLGQIEVYFKT